MTIALKPTALKSPEMTRRSLLAGIGGMTFCFALGTDGTKILPAAQAAGGPVNLSPWVRIAPDGTITLLTVTEMGQGTGTSIPLDDRRGDGRRLVEGGARLGALEAGSLRLAESLAAAAT